LKPAGTSSRNRQASKILETANGAGKTAAFNQGIFPKSGIVGTPVPQG
jgi:hypothetical protein